MLRGIPDLLVIYLFYFGGSAALGAVGSLFGDEGFIGVPAFATGALAIGVVSGAYQAEVFRGAYQTLSKGELEAAKSVGMHRWLMFRRIIAPQVLRYAIPGLGNVWQLVLKESGADLGHGPRRAPAPVADRRRLDAPSVRLLHHRRGALPSHHLGLDDPVPEGGDRSLRGVRRAA